MGWRCTRKLKRIAKMAVEATAAAHANPVPAQDEDFGPTIYLGDTLALGLMYGELSRGGTSWKNDPTDCGRKLRDIASVLEAWRDLGDYLQEQFPGDPERQFRTGAEMKRNMLATIGWLIAGKTMDEIQRDERETK